jgi:Domain of unknown function (DUF4397)
MKNYTNISKNLLVRIGGLCVLTLALSSCLKTNNSYYNPAVALVTFVQASPDAPAMDFYLNNNKVNVSPVNFGDNISYFKANIGQRTANCYVAGTQTKIFSDTTTFKENYVYSLFLANKVSSPQFLRLTDTIAQPASGKANIRFVNMSPDAPAVDLAVQGGAVLVTNRAFKGFSSFAPVTGNTTYTLEVRQAGTNTVLATLAGVQLYSGFVYTIWLRGLATPTNNTNGLNVGIMTNAFYN